MIFVLNFGPEKYRDFRETYKFHSPKQTKVLPPPLPREWDVSPSQIYLRMVNNEEKKRSKAFRTGKQLDTEASKVNSIKR